MTRLELVGSVLDEVDLSGQVLRVAGVELNNILERAEGVDGDVEGSLGDVEGDTLVAGGSGQGTGVLRHSGAVEERGEVGEVKGVGVGDVPGIGDVANVGKGSGHDGRDGIRASGNFDEEANNSEGLI